MNQDDLFRVYKYYVSRSQEVARGVVLKTDTFNECGKRDQCVPVVDKLEASEVHCVEIDGARAAICQEKFPQVKVHHADLLEVEFDAGKFDTILDISTIDHVYDWAGLLDRYVNWLKVGGTLLVIVWLAEKFDDMGVIGTDVQLIFEREKFTQELKKRFKIESMKDDLLHDEERTLTEFTCKRMK